MGTRSDIAVVGMGCRFVSVSSLQDFWRMLVEGRCPLKEIPPDRFPIQRYYDPRPGTRGKTCTREGGYLDDISRFDALFFRISAREAAVMDPQQRVLLEVAWHALEDAGLTIDPVKGARAGVYVGLFNGDYRDRMIKRQYPDFDVYTEVGVTRSSAAGRISYALNLHGPAAAVDAACASSLVAVYLACQSIWSGDADFALAGGSNVILEPDSTVSFSRSGMLSPESRCKFGDASGNGFVRSEGAGVVVLKPLEQAVRDGDRVYAVIKAAACNNDARLGEGLYMTPSQEGQKTLLRRVYQEQHLPLDRLAYVEAHGTGTRAGDPVETSAIAEVLGQMRQSPDPLYLGSVKTNIGHTEGAAGIAALIKTSLVLHHRLIPPSLHLKTPNPDIPWEKGRIVIPTQSVPLPVSGPVMAGVSSFGLSGTNAHVALETWEAPAERPQPSPDALVLPLSAHLPSALKARAARFHAWLSNLNDDATLPDLCHTAAVRRSHFSHRLAVTGSTREALLEALLPYVDAEADDEAPARSPANKVVFVFPGQGGQWAGMGRAMLTQEPAFRQAILALDRVFREQEGWSILELLEGEDNSWTQNIARIQPGLFAIQVAMSEVWKSYGVRPDAVVGHSLGEVGAAYVAGALSLEDAVRVICARSQALARIKGLGQMLVVGLDLEEATHIIQGLEEQIAIAVSNSRASTVLSGDPVALNMVLDELTRKEVHCTKVDVDVASHSPQTEPLLHDLRLELAGIRPLEGQVPLYSTVHADLHPGKALGPDYWAANMRCAVRFYETSLRLLEHGHDIFIEVGPHPVLLNPLLKTLFDEKASAIAVGSMRRDEHNRLTLLAGVGRVYSHGYPVRWEGIYPLGRCVTLPDYPFQPQEHWFETADEAGHLLESSAPGSRVTAQGTRAHPLLPRFFRLGSSAGSSVWEVPVSTRHYPWLVDHQVRGNPVMPGAGYVEIALAASRELLRGQDFALEDLEFQEYLAVPALRERSLQVQLSRLSPSTAQLRFYSFEPGVEDGPVHLHATARLRIRETASSREGRGTAPPRAGSAHASERLLERLDAELERSRHNPSYHAALVSVLCTPQEQAEEAAGEPPAAGLASTEARDTLFALLGARLQGALRATDVVQAVAPGHFLVLLPQVQQEEDLWPVGNRLYALLTDALEAEGQAQAFTLTVAGELLEPADDAPAALRKALAWHREEHSLSGEPPLAETSSAVLAAAPFYASMEARGIGYGPLFRPVVQVARTDRKSLSTLHIPDATLADAGEYLLHPAILDGCFQAAVAAFLLNDDFAGKEDTILPVGIRQLVFHQVPTQELTCRAWLRGTPGGRADELELDFLVTDRWHRPVVEVGGFRVRRLEKGATLAAGSASASWFHRWSWQASPLAAESAAAQTSGTWAVVELEAGQAADLTEVLQAADQTCQVIPAAKVPATRVSGKLAGALLVLSHGEQASGASGQGVMEGLARRCAEVVEAVRTLAGHGPGQASRIWLVTRGAWPAGGDLTVRVDQAPYWGLGRVMANELPGLELRMLDLPVEASAADLAVAARLLLEPSREDELAVRGGTRLVHRLSQVAPEVREFRPVERIIAAEESLRVVWPQDGSAARLEPVVRRLPGPEEVEVEVLAAACETERAREGFAGLAGVVRRVGEGVSGLRVGEAVLACLAGEAEASASSLSRFLCLPRQTLAPAPAWLSPVQACILPAFFLPAALALDRLGRLEAGDRILVQSGSSAVGRAAIWLAIQRGAEVFATASGREAREALRQSGVTHVLEEHGEGLGAFLRDLTGGQGLDLVINTLGPEGLRRVAEALRPGGQVVDLSGAAASSLEVSLPVRNVSAASLDLGELCRVRPDLIQRGLSSLSRYLEEGRLETWGADRVLSLGELPRLGRKPALAGEVSVLALPGAEDEVTRATVAEPVGPRDLFRADGVYLLTGGTGGLGLSVAGWMAGLGAGTLVLLSRSGRENPECVGMLDELRARGARVVVMKGDVGDEASLNGALHQLREGYGPLRGVIHLAGILDDATLERQDRERFERVMLPKVVGALNLDRLTRQDPLEHFVLFASAATTLGSPGQANYAAANAFMDALAYQRQQEGRPALSIHWGMWSEVGLSVRADIRGGRLESRGLFCMAPAQAMEAFENAMLHERSPEVGIFAIDWSRWARAFPRAMRSPSVSELVQEQSLEAEAEEANVRERVLSAEAAQRPKLVLDYLLKELASVLRMPPAMLNTAYPLPQLGIDSLMAVELRGRIQRDLQAELKGTRILSLPNLKALAAVILAEVAPEEKVLEVVVEPAAAPLTLAAGVKVSGPVEAVTDPRAVFLTGATGFLGVHLLRELLDRTRATVHCLVRAPDQETAWKRLEEALIQFGLWREGDLARIVPVRGDLAQARLGLTEEAFEALAGQVEVIYHCGAWINYLYSEAVLAPTNVGGTAEVLALAALGRPKPVHHVSTVGVFPYTDRGGEAILVDEQTPLEERAEPFMAGYAQTKWAAERLVEQARARGLNVNIYRAGAITGSTHAASCPSGDFIWRVVQAVTEVDAAPAVDTEVGMSPVDFVARALVTLSIREDARNQTYHVIHPRQVSVAQLVGRLRAMGYPVEEVSFFDWARRLELGVGPGSGVYPILGALLELDLQALASQHITVSSQRTMAKLEGLGLDGLGVDEALLDRYLQVFLQQGYLPEVPLEEAVEATAAATKALGT